MKVLDMFNDDTAKWNDSVAEETDNQVAEEKPGLWSNIQAKRERIKKGSGERMRKPGSKGAPSDSDIKSARGGVSETADVRDQFSDFVTNFKKQRGIGTNKDTFTPAQVSQPATIDRDTLLARLRELESQFDAAFDYSDDHGFWTKHNEIKHEINDIKKKLKQGVAEGQLNELDIFAPRTVYFKMADGNYIKADYRGSEGFTGGHKANDNVSFTSMSWVPPNVTRSLGLDKFLAKGSYPNLGTLNQNARNIVGTSSAGEGPFGNRTIDVVDFVNSKEDTVPSALKTKVMQWVQKNQPKSQAQTQGVAEGLSEDSILDEAAPLIDKLGLSNWLRKVQNQDSSSQKEIRILSGVNHAMQLYFKTILAFNASVAPAAALFWPILGKQALLFVGGALFYVFGKILATKIGKALFGSAEEALAWAKAHLEAGKNKKATFIYDGKTYPVTVIDPDSIAELDMKILDLEQIITDRKNISKSANAKKDWEEFVKQSKQKRLDNFNKQANDESNRPQGVAEGSEEKPIKKSDWFDPTDMRSPEKQKAAYLNHLAAKKRNKNIGKKQGVAEGKFTINAKTGAKLDPRTGVELPPKEKPMTMKQMFAQPKQPKLTLDDVWLKIQSVVSNIYPDGDPINHLAPWLEKHGIRNFKIGEILDRAAKKNGYKDLYDYWESMGDLPLSEQGVAEGGILKSIKRGLQGWGTGDAPTPQELVRQNKGHSDDTIKALAIDTRKVIPHSPADLQKRVVDREMKKRGLGEEGVAEGNNSSSFNQEQNLRSKSNKELADLIQFWNRALEKNPENKNAREQLGLIKMIRAERIGKKGVAEGSEVQKTFKVVYHSPKTDRNVTKMIKASNESEIWDKLHLKGIQVISVTEQGVAEGSVFDTDTTGYTKNDMDFINHDINQIKKIRAKLLKIPGFARKVNDETSQLQLAEKIFNLMKRGQTFNGALVLAQKNPSQQDVAEDLDAVKINEGWLIDTLKNVGKNILDRLAPNDKQLLVNLQRKMGVPVAAQHGKPSMARTMSEKEIQKLLDAARKINSSKELKEQDVTEGAGEKDACYRKVKSKYKIWPSAYASGALVKCRKVGAKNWGSSKK